MCDGQIHSAYTDTTFLNQIQPQGTNVINDNRAIIETKMFEPLLEETRKLDDASLLTERLELLQSSKLTRGSCKPPSTSFFANARPVLAIPGDISLEQVRNLATETHDKSVSSSLQT